MVKIVYHDPPGVEDLPLHVNPGTGIGKKFAEKMEELLFPSRSSTPRRGETNDKAGS